MPRLDRAERQASHKSESGSAFKNDQRGRKWKQRSNPAPLLAGRCWSSTAIHSRIAPITPSEIDPGLGRKPAGAILGFANMLLRLYREEQPRAVLVAWDTLEAPTYRHEQFPAYQSGREFDDACSSNSRCCRNLSPPAALRMPKRRASRQMIFSPPLPQKKKSAAVPLLIASGDRDTFQLASDRTTILYPIRAGEMARIGPDEVRARYGVDPAQVPDFIALRGDPSDKLPGAPGVGATGAATLLQRYGTLEAALAAGRFPAQAENLRLYRSIATMDKKAPLPSLRNQKPTWRRAADLAGRWQLKQLAGRLDELGR